MSKSPWGKVGNWAAEAERAEAEEREAAGKAAADQHPGTFPSLMEAVTTAKQKKKTKMTMTLQEFTMQQSTHSGSASSRGLTTEEMLRLPTGPKERSPDEIQHGRSGGGFNNYGSRAGSWVPNTGRPRDYDGRRSYGFDDDNRGGHPPESRVSDLNQPSRADEVDNWASMKKQTVPDYHSPQYRSGGRYSSVGGVVSTGAGSRADEVDNWASVKKQFPQTQQARYSAFGPGSSRPNSDRWAHKEQGFGQGLTRPEPDRWTHNEQKLAMDTPKNEIDAGSKASKSNPFGEARPREEVLAEKGLDWKKLDFDIEVKKQTSVSRPTSSHSSRPGSQQSSRSDVPVALGNERPKVNPFGNAKPREVLLQEKGLDWRKIDHELEHRRIERPETEHEKDLKETIEHLKNEVLKLPVEDQPDTHDRIRQKEHELDMLVRQMDDKARYTQKISERKYSGPFKGPGFNDRSLSQPGSQNEQPRPGLTERPGSWRGEYEDPRGSECNERPLSRGTGNSWARPGDDRRSHSGRGSTGSRDTDRSWSRR